MNSDQVKQALLDLLNADTGLLLNTCRLLMTHKKKIPCIKPWEQPCLLRH